MLSGAGEQPCVPLCSVQEQQFSASASLEGQQPSHLEGIAAVQLHRRGAASLQKGHFQVLPVLRRVPLPTGPEGYLL